MTACELYLLHSPYRRRLAVLGQAECVIWFRSTYGVDGKTYSRTFSRLLWFKSSEGKYAAKAPSNVHSYCFHYLSFVSSSLTWLFRAWSVSMFKFNPCRRHMTFWWTCWTQYCTIALVQIRFADTYHNMGVSPIGSNLLPLSIRVAPRPVCDFSLKISPAPECSHLTARYHIGSIQIWFAVDQ